MPARNACSISSGQMARVWEGRIVFREAFPGVAFELDLKSYSEIPQGRLSSGAFQAEGTSPWAGKALGTVQLGWRAGL